MNSFLTNIRRFFLVQFCIAAVLFIFAWDNIDTKLDYDGSLIDKHARLERLTGPRLVFVGGSNVAFGIDSSTFEERLPYQPVNMATHVGVGRHWMIEDVRDEIREGDVVIVSFEYGLFRPQTTEWPNIIRALRIHPASVEALTWGQVREFLDDGIKTAGEYGRRGLKRLLRFDFSPASPPNYAYTRAWFNKYGDNVGSLDGRAVPKRFNEPHAYSNITSDVIESVAEELNDFNRDCELRGARLFFTYAPLVESHYPAAEETLRRLHEELEARLVFPILTTPEEMVVGEDFIFDSVQHLNQAGKEWRSALLAERIGGQLSGATGLVNSATARADDRNGIARGQ